MYKYTQIYLIYRAIHRQKKYTFAYSNASIGFDYHSSIKMPTKEKLPGTPFSLFTFSSTSIF